MLRPSSNRKFDDPHCSKTLPIVLLQPGWSDLGVITVLLTAGVVAETLVVSRLSVRIQHTLMRIDNGKSLALGEPKTKKSRRTIHL